jgi:uncharacterized protein
MLPISIEEQLICYADNFFSKSKKNGQRVKAKSVEWILHNLKCYGTDKVHRFRAWVEMFGG